jgi:hypothetical protein
MKEWTDCQGRVLEEEEENLLLDWILKFGEMPKPREYQEPVSHKQRFREKVQDDPKDSGHREVLSTQSHPVPHRLGQWVLWGDQHGQRTKEAVLGFDFRASHLVGRSSTTGATLPVIFGDRLF